MKKISRKKETEKNILSGKLTKEDIKKLIDDELSKNPDDIDTDYVDLCFDILEKFEKNNVSSFPQGKIQTKTLLIAAVVIILVVSTLTASAITFGIPQKIAQLINGDVFFDYGLENADKTADGYALGNTELAKKIKEAGVSPVTIPEKFTENNCVINSIEKKDRHKDGTEIDVYADLTFDGIVCEMHITTYDWQGDESYKEPLSGELVRANGLDVMVLKFENESVIIYKDGKNRYELRLYTKKDIARDFAMTIK